MFGSVFDSFPSIYLYREATNNVFHIGPKTRSDISRLVSVYLRYSGGTLALKVVRIDDFTQMVWLAHDITSHSQFPLKDAQ